MLFQSRLDENTYVLIDAETSGAFAKNDLGVEASPDKALGNILDLTGKLARGVSVQLAEQMKGLHGEVDVTFALKSDTFGQVMIAARPTDGQFTVNVRWSSTLG